jgi:hypothetical protein
MEGMTLFRWSLAAAIPCALSVAVACSGVDASRLGDFNALKNESAPVPGLVGGAATKDAGAVACTPPDAAAACTTSFKTDIVPIFSKTGSGQCANGSGCHGKGGQYVLDDANPPAMWTALTSRALSGSTRKYVDPCSADPNSGYLLCNLAGDIACGQKMPLGTPLPDTDIAKIKAWLTCGAPNN